MKNKQKYLGMGLIAAGCCFLFDPFISVVDLIPDFIGYALICAGLSRLRDINDRIEESRRLMMRLMILSLARVLSLVLVFSMGQSELATALLLVGFALSVLDCMTLIPAWRHLTSGWLYVGSRLDGRAILADKKGSRKSVNVTEKLGRQTVTFLLIKEALGVLPEFAALTMVTESGTTGMNWYAYISLFREVAMVISLVLGIIWLVRVFRYVNVLKKDEPFWSALQEKYEREAQTATHVFVQRRLYAGTVCVALGVVASIDFHIDGMEILPGLLSAALFLVGALLFRPCVVGKWKATVVLSILYAPLSVIAWVARWRFETTSYVSAVLKDTEAGEQFYTMCGLSLASEVAFLAALGSVLWMLYAIVKQHTGYEAENPNDARTIEGNRLLRRSLNLRLTVAYLVTAVATIGRVACTAAWPYTQQMQWRIGKVSLPNTDSVLYGADVVLHVILVMLFWTALTSIREEINAKYRLR